MSNIRINAFPTRQQFTYAGGLPQFVVNFPFFDSTDLFVYLSNPANNFEQQDPINILTLGVDYTVAGAGLATGGLVTLNVNPTVGYTVTIVGRMAIDRFSIYETSSVISMAQLNEDFNRLVVMVQNINTIIEQTMPKYDRSELVQTARSFPNTPFSYTNLPMLETGETWIGNPTNTGLTKFLLSPLGVGTVVAAAPGMRQSIVLWTGTDFVVTDSNLLITGDYITKAVGAGESTGFSDAWAAVHLPAHNSAARPVAPVDGDVYYDSALNQFFGYQNGAWVAFATGGAIPNSQIVTITQPGHGFNFNGGQWVYIEDVTGTYKLASAPNPMLAETWYMTLSATLNTFTIQGGTSYVAAGTVVGVAGLTPGLYFLSENTLGGMTLAQPATIGAVSKPVFAADSANSGWILSATGYVIGAPNGGGATTDTNIVDASQPGNGFALGDAIYATTVANVYAKAIGNGTYAQADRVGFVITVGDPAFQYQTEGNCVGAVLMDELGAAMVPGQRYWISVNPLHPGRLTSVEPTTPGQYSVPAYIPYAVGGGIITQDGPRLITNPAAAGGNQLIISYDLAGLTQLTVHNLAALVAGTYADIHIVLDNVVCINLTTANYYGEKLWMQLEFGGNLKTDAQYYSAGAPLDHIDFLNPQFWTNANSSFLDQGGRTMNARMDIFAANSTTVIKPVTWDATYFHALNAYYPTHVTSNNTNNTSCYSAFPVLDTTRLTGFKLSFDPTAFPFQFVQGTLSVYGTVN